MYCPLILLEALTVHDYLVQPNYWPGVKDLVNWCVNMDPITIGVLIICGFLFLFNGFKLHRQLIALTGAIVGGYLGAGLAMRVGLPVLAGAPAGAILLGVVAWFATAWSVAAVGSICGAFFGAAAWSVYAMDPRLTWCGALAGAVVVGILCFVIFRISVILFTSLQGSAMLVMGVLGVAYQYPVMRPHLAQSVPTWRYSLPSVIFVLMLIGLAYQYLKGPRGGGKSAPARSESKPAERKPARAEA